MTEDHQKKPWLLTRIVYGSLKLYWYATGQEFPVDKGRKAQLAAMKINPTKIINNRHADLAIGRMRRENSAARIQEKEINRQQKIPVEGRLKAQPENKQPVRDITPTNSPKVIHLRKRQGDRLQQLHEKDRLKQNERELNR